MHYHRVRARSEAAPSFLPPERLAVDCRTSRGTTTAESLAEPVGRPFNLVARTLGGTESGARGGIEPFAAYAEHLLVAAIAAGSRSALQRLHFQYFPQLVKFFGNLLVTFENDVVEDLIAETIFRVWRESAQLPTQTSVHVWIMRTAYTCASERLAMRGHRTRSSLRPPFRGTHGYNRVSTELKSAQQVLRVALDGLPVIERAVVHLVYAGHSRQEVADILSMPCEAVDLHLASSLVALDPWLAQRAHRIADSSTITAQGDGAAASRA